MTFKDIIRQLRESKGWTQKEASKMLNIGTSTLGSYEIGEREPSFVTLVDIAKLYNVNLDYLMGRTTIKSTWENFTKEIKIVGQDSVRIDSLISDICGFDRIRQIEVVDYIEYLKMKIQDKSK